jgi:two-component system sensor histidine kinase/response regulator
MGDMPGLQAVRVLIAEDDPVTAHLIEAQLQKRGYSVVGRVVSGRDAFSMAERLRPDVVIMDIEMSDLDGIEATRQIQEHCPTPVVILTSHEDDASIERASAAGAGAYLVKPPRGDEMERVITIAVARFKDMMELRERNQELDSFAHTVAHDLKNPLSVLISYGELIESECGSVPADELRSWARVIAEKGHETISIVNELLLLASLRRRDVVTQPLKMGEVVEVVLRRLANLIERHQAEIKVATDWPSALGYRPWVEEVWVNYLDNALKYGGSPPQVELGATTQADGKVRCWVHDNGDGLTAEQQARLFTPLTRLDNTRATGHGLGLSIVRRIVEKLGGCTGVESAGVPGEGCLFYFVLPNAGPSASK